MTLIVALALAPACCRQAALPWQFNAKKTGRKAGFIFRSDQTAEAVHLDTGRLMLSLCCYRLMHIAIIKGDTMFGFGKKQPALDKHPDHMQQHNRR